jgi:serine/threonine-protein kinase RsbW
MEALTLPGRLDVLSRLREYIAEAAEQAGLSRKQTNRLKLAVDEIAANAVMHGYESKGWEGDLCIKAEFSDDALTIILEDKGELFDPSGAPPPDDLDDALDARKIGGLGIYLTLRQVSEFRYERDGDKNRNIFIMKKD